MESGDDETMKGSFAVFTARSLLSVRGVEGSGDGRGRSYWEGGCTNACFALLGPRDRCRWECSF